MSPLVVHLANATPTKVRRPHFGEWLAGIAIIGLPLVYYAVFG